MEFAIVTFPTVRGVNVDGAPMGQTGEILRLQRGTHIFDLGSPPNYSPESRTITLTGTTFDRPRAVIFTKVPSARRAVRRRSAAKKTSSARRRKTSTPRRRKAPARRRKVSR